LVQATGGRLTRSRGLPRILTLGDVVKQTLLGTSEPLVRRPERPAYLAGVGLPAFEYADRGEDAGRGEDGPVGAGWRVE
jgi:hypothetical protein